MNKVTSHPASPLAAPSGIRQSKKIIQKILLARLYLCHMTLSQADQRQKEGKGKSEKRQQIPILGLR